MRTSTEVTGLYRPGDIVAITHIPHSGIVCKCDANYVLQFGERQAVVVNVVPNVEGRKEFGERVTWNEYKHTSPTAAAKGGAKGDGNDKECV